MSARDWRNCWSCGLPNPTIAKLPLPRLPAGRRSAATWLRLCDWARTVFRAARSGDSRVYLLARDSQRVPSKQFGLQKLSRTIQVQRMDELEFPLGRARIGIPADRLYTRTHMWCLPLDQLAGMGGCVPVRADAEDRPADALWRVGFTAFAMTLIRDVFFLDWEHELDGSHVSAGQEVGTVESAKAVSSIHSPLAGRLLRFNLELLDDPSLLNADCYGRGWLFELSASRGETLMGPVEYHKLLTDTWPDVQRKLKGRYLQG